MAGLAGDIRSLPSEVSTVTAGYDSVGRGQAAEGLLSEATWKKLLPGWMVIQRVARNNTAP